jgi:hypothetical protein
MITAIFLANFLGNFFDLLYQGDQHGWIPRFDRGKIWPWYVEWIPHDPWHAIHSARNWLLATSYFMGGYQYAPAPSWLELLTLLAIYAVGRLLGFTVGKWYITKEA